MFNRIELDPLSEGSSKEMNLLYVLQEDLVISEDLKGSISSFELPGEHVSLGSMIGKGAFGEVYIGEALGVNNNHYWTTVAIKTLAGLVLCNISCFVSDSAKTLDYSFSISTK
jgi:hypothetical protein